MIACLLQLATWPDLESIFANPKLGGAIVAAIVTDLAGKPIYELNSSLHVVPASNQKLLSNSFALWSRGEAYQPKTRFWRLSDRIVIDAPGDPLMSYAQLIQARQQLKIDRRLPVYVRQSYSPEVPDSWEIDDLPNRFSAAVTALTFDRGGFEVWDRNGKAVIEPARFDVGLTHVPGPGKPIVEYDLFAHRVRVTGTLPKANERLDTLAYLKPDDAAASVFGIPAGSTMEIPNREPDVVITGGSIRDMVAKCLPPSDNNIAENLLMLGAGAEGELGAHPYGVARQRLQNFLTRIVGVDPQDVHPYDGSGLSRHNLVTVRAIAKILSWADKQSTSGFWHGSLAHPGTGTLTNRLQGVEFQGKTGSLDMVAALSGYLTTRSGKKLIVSIVLNQFTCTAAEARAVEDQFIHAVAAD